MPLWLDGVAGHFAMPVWFAGLAVILQLGGAALFNLATPILFRDRPLLSLARGAMAVAGVAYMLALIPNAFIFIFALFLSGAALGVGLNVTNRLMGSTEHVQHGYALFVLMEVIVATLLFLSGSVLIERFGLVAVFAELALMAGVAIVLLFRLPIAGVMARTESQKGATALSRAGFVGLAAFGCFFIGQATINSFMPVIGQLAGLSQAAANQAIGLGMPFGFFGGMLARIVGERVRPMVPVIFVITLLACVAPALAIVHDASFFRIGVIVLACSTMFVVPYFFAQLGAFDHGGRFTSFGPAMMLAGLAVGPSSAVLLRSWFGIGAVGVFSAVMLVIGGLAFVLAVRSGARATYATTSPAKTAPGPLAEQEP